MIETPNYNIKYHFDIIDYSPIQKAILKPILY